MQTSRKSTAAKRGVIAKIVLAWLARSRDAEPGELGSTGRTALNGAVYDAHIRAVKLQARVAKMSEWQMFHELRWGRGNLAFAPSPPELEGSESRPDASEAAHLPKKKWRRTAHR